MYQIFSMCYLLTVRLLTVPLAAQDRAAVNGTVTDPSGAVIAASRGRPEVHRHGASSRHLLQ